MDDSRSHGLWEKTAPPAPPTPALSRDCRADVAIIGAGYTGLSAALTLAEAGRDCVVLEAEDVGFGGSGRNVGLVNAGVWITPDETRAALGEPYGERLLRFLGAAPDRVFERIARHEIACEATRVGTLHCAVGWKGGASLAARAAQWQALGAPVRLLDAAETAARTGSSAFAGALLDQRAGTIQPLAYARGLARAALEAGATIHTGSRVTAARPDPGGGWCLTTPGGDVRASWLIMATNAWSAFARNGLRAELAILPYFNFATAPLGAALREAILPGGHGLWDTRDILTSVRLDAAGRLIIGSVGALAGAGLGVHEGWARRALARIFPQLGEVAFESGWWGRIGTTSDSVPRLHRLGERAMAFHGYNGRGIAPGTAFGEALAHVILGRTAMEDLPLPVSPVTPIRGRVAREKFYALGALAAHVSGARI